MAAFASCRNEYSGGSTSMKRMNALSQYDRPRRPTLTALPRSSESGSVNSRRQFPSHSNTRGSDRNSRSVYSRQAESRVVPPSFQSNDIGQHYQTPRVATGPTPPIIKSHGSKKNLALLLALALIAFLIALLRFDMLPLVHIGAESLIWASLLSTLLLIAYGFFVLCRGLWRMYRAGYKAPVLAIPLGFAGFAASYLSLNVATQAFDPAIDRVLKDLPSPGPRTVFARRGDSYQQVIVPIDRRISAEEISNSVMRDAIIAVEDERLETRFGPIDLEALLRGAVKTFVLRRRREGGSTILIQAAKNILKWRARSDVVETDISSVAKTEGKESLSRALIRKCEE